MSPVWTTKNKDMWLNIGSNKVLTFTLNILTGTSSNIK